MTTVDYKHSNALVKNFFDNLELQFTVSMKTLQTKILIQHLLYLLVSSGYPVYGLAYDHNFTPECLEIPLKPQYGGGIAVKPELNDGYKGWSSFEMGKRESNHGNKFILALNLNGSHDTLSQKFNLEKFYVISAWLKVSHGDANVAAIIKTRSVSNYAGWSVARSGCWSMFKSGVTINSFGPAELYFESDDASTDLWVDSISVQPFTQKEWRNHQQQSIQKIRKGKVNLRVVDSQGRPLANASIAIKQLEGAFPLGNAVRKNILSLPAYQRWFTKRFKYTVFENEMKWYINEPCRGQENYTLADGMLQFVKKHKIKARGHNVVWENPHWLPLWTTSLSPREFAVAANRRVHSLMERYSGEFIHWDVVNENLHFSFLESKLGETASTVFYEKIRCCDKLAIPFLNEFGTIEDQHDKYSSPYRYLEKIKKIRSQGYPGPLGIGLQGHFTTPNLAYVRAALDVLASAKLPVWITELDVPNNHKQAAHLKKIIKELHSQPAVEGIMIWSPWSPPLCYRMCLTDGNFTNLPTGDVVDKFLRKWTRNRSVGITDADGCYETSLFYGVYQVEVSHQNPVTNSSQVYSFKVASNQNIEVYA